MVASRVSRLVAPDSVPEVDTVDKPELGHAVECAIDARDPDAGSARTDAIVNLVCRKAAVLLTEELDDDSARAAAAPARLA